MSGGSLDHSRFGGYKLIPSSHTIIFKIPSAGRLLELPSAASEGGSNLSADLLCARRVAHCSGGCRHAG